MAGAEQLFWAARCYVEDTSAMWQEPSLTMWGLRISLQKLTHSATRKINTFPSGLSPF